MIRVKHLHLAPCLLLAAIFALTAGCGDSGPPRGAVEGTVTFDGTPVDGGRIVFIAADKKPGMNADAAIEGGKYSLPAAKGPAIGTHRVEIVWYKKTGKQVKSSDPPNMEDEMIQIIPKKYNVASTTTEQVKAGKNTFNYDLKSK